MCLDLVLVRLVSDFLKLCASKRTRKFTKGATSVPRVKRSAAHTLMRLVIFSHCVADLHISWANGHHAYLVLHAAGV